MKQDFSFDTNLLPVSSVNISFVVASALKKLNSNFDATEINNFRKNAKVLITTIVQKLAEHSPLKHQLIL